MRRAVTLISIITKLAASTYAVEVSICGDATYDLPQDRGVICSSADPIPPGTACPLKGDKTSTHCYENLPSYNRGVCVAPEDAVCTLVTNRTWGCVFPSVGCGSGELSSIAPAVPADPQCETWDYSESSSRSSIDVESLLDGNGDFDKSWFVEKIKVTVVFACGTDKPTAAPTFEPTPAPTSDCSEASDVELVPVLTTETTDSLASKPPPEQKSELSLSGVTASEPQIASATPVLTSDIEELPGVVHPGSGLASDAVDLSQFRRRFQKNDINSRKR